MTEVQYILFFGSLCLLVLSGLGKHAQKVHSNLYQLCDLARQSATIEDLCQTEQKLRKYAQRHCYHRHLASHAREVLAYIQGRKQEMKKN